MPPTTPQRRATPRRATTPARRPTTTARRPLRRKQPDPSKAQQFLGMIGRAAPTKAVSGAGKKKPMGLAMLGAGAAAAFTQREKLVGMFGKRKEEMSSDTPTPERPVAAATPPVAPATSPVVAPERSDGSEL